MGEWQEITIGELLKLQRGHDLPQSEFVHGPYQVAGSNGAIGFHNKFTTLGPGLTIGRSGNSIGVAHYYENDFWAHNTVLYGKEFYGSDPKFIYFLLKSIDFKSLDAGSAIPSLNRNHVHPITVRAPKEIDEQKAIAEVLSSLDDKIDLLHRQNKTLESLAQTLFRQWFTEEANESWNNGAIRDLVNVLSGFAFKSSEFVEDGKYRLVTIKSVQDGYLDLSRTDNLNSVPDRMPDYCFLQSGDILLSLTGNVGRCCLVDESSLLLNQRVAKLSPKNPRDRAFTYVMFRQSRMKTSVEELAKGTAQLNLSPVEMANMSISLPPESLLALFAENANPILDKLLKNRGQIKVLGRTRDYLLQKLMSGEVTVDF